MRLFAMMAALPIGLAVLSAWQRRRSTTWLARRAWLVRMVAAVPYLTLAAVSYTAGERVAGGMYAAAGLSLLGFGVIERWFDVQGRQEKESP